MHVQQLENGRGALRRILRGAVGHAAQTRHLVRREKLPQIGPAFHAFRAAHLDQPMLVFEDLEFLAVFGGARDGRFRAQIPPQVQRARAGVSFANRRSLVWLRRARNQEAQQNASCGARQHHKQRFLLLV